MTTVTKRARLLLALFILISGIGCDQITKQIATEQLRGSPPLSFLGDTVRLHYTENRGAFLGLGNTLSPELRFWTLTVQSQSCWSGYPYSSCCNGILPLHPLLRYP